MKIIRNLIAAATVCFLAASCGGSGSSDPSDSTAGKGETVSEILGAGATFPFPLYSKMFDAYKTKTNIAINYQSIGSGGGIKQLQNKTVDFGASDAPMSDDDLSKSPAAIMHIPTCLGAVVVAYNIDGNPKLKFSPDVLADIFLGKIKKWNDARIKADNPDAKLPSMDITVVHRSDGSGTTYVFSDYLSKVSPDWATKPGKGKSLDWPVGIGAKGNEGVGGMVKQTPGSIGYVELAYVIQNNMSGASIKNKSGNFIDASLASISASANVAIPEDFRVSLTNTDAADGYPISSFTYILVYTEQGYDTRTEAQAKGTVDLINWMTHEGQQYAAPLNYAALPDGVVKSVEAALKKITYKSKPLMQ
ncbi:MAG: phosphate ABC transporter substrate-binding protein PstS [Bacteroidetes bacterium]|nr:phosphate ABC transporter substrate-binding protein PstS [Bacteroidota bacterium]